MKLVAVNGRRYTPEVLDTAIAEAHTTRHPIELMVLNDDFFRTVSVAYYDGPRWPHLTQISGHPDCWQRCSRRARTSPQWWGWLGNRRQ